MNTEERRKRIEVRQERARRALAALGRSPDAVIDIGVRRGTPWLYETFADAFFVLVDPQEGGEALLASRPARYLFVNKALGRAPGRMLFHEQGSRSTFLERTALTRVATAKSHDVEVVTLDRLIAETLPHARKIGLKLDTEGFELEIVAGLAERLDRIDFIVSEVSILNRFENSYNFSELVGELWRKDFRFYNFLGGGSAVPPRICDCIFLRKDDAAFDGGGDAAGSDAPVRSDA